MIDCETVHTVLLRHHEQKKKKNNNNNRKQIKSKRKTAPTTIEKIAACETSAGDASSVHRTSISVSLGFQPANNSDPLSSRSSLLTIAKAVLLPGPSVHGHRAALHARLRVGSPLSRSWTYSVPGG